MSTKGDRILDRSLAAIGGKGLFIKELEAALEDGRADLAVHSMKDVPGDLPAGMMLAAMLPRADPRDALIARGARGPRRAAAGRAARHLEPAPPGAAARPRGRTSTSSHCAATSIRGSSAWTTASSMPSCSPPPA